MPTRPRIVTITNTSAEVLNAIRNDASTDFKDYVPVATDDAESIRAIGAVIMDSTALRNEFIDTLVNRIARVIVTSKTYDNPWAVFKRGMLEFGETVEEVFVDLIKPHQFDVEKAESELFKREKPNVHTAFHHINYQEFYKVTIEQEMLRRAFLSADGVTDLINRIVTQIYTSANYDEYQVMKYMLAKCVYDGKIKMEQVTAVPSEIVTVIKGVSNDLEFMSSKYNIAHVKTHTAKADQFLLQDTRANANIDVNVLAQAFNMDKAEFMGHQLLMDGLGNLDTERLDLLLANDPSYKSFTSEEAEALNNVKFILMDREFPVILDNLLDMTDVRNGQGLYWNYIYHVWKTFSISPFSNAIAFSTTLPTVSNVTVAPSSVTLAEGSSIALTPTVTTTNFAPQTVTYSSNNDKVVVSNSGVVTVLEGATGTAKITVTSQFNTTKKAECNITIG